MTASAGAEAGPAADPAARAIERVLVELLALERELCELEYVRRADALERAGDAVRVLGELGSADGILARAAAELGVRSQFERILISEVSGDRLTPLALWTASHEGGADGAGRALRERPIRLAYPLREAEVASRRRVEIVSVSEGGARAAGALSEALGLRSYVVGALVAEGETIGLLHADAEGSGRPVDEIDAEVVAKFTQGLSGVLERAVLRHTLELHRAELQSAAQWMSGRLSRLSHTETVRPGSEAGRRMVQSLTPRELEVLRLLARGQHEPRDRGRARGPRRHGEVPRQEHPAQARCLEPRRRGVAVRALLVAGGGTMSRGAPCAVGRHGDGRRATAMLAGPLGAELERRIARAGATAEQLLLLPRRPADRERLRELAAGLSERLAAIRPDDAEALEAEHEAALRRLRERFDARFEALSLAHGAVLELRELTSPTGMLGRAPSALCAASNFERAILSLVGGGQMVAEAAHFEGSPAGAEAVLAGAASGADALEHPLIETELLRRRRATIVVDAHIQPRADRRLAELMGWTSYAAAPLVVGPRVIGVVHADRGREGALDVLDSDVLWEFATALAQAYESASLVRTPARRARADALVPRNGSARARVT